MPYLLALDQGTTSSRAVVYDLAGRVRAQARRPLALAYPRPGWVEADPEAIFRGVLEAAREALARAGAKAGEVVALGLTNQRETTLIWERPTGRPLAPAIVWQDRRTAPLTDRLRAEGAEPGVRERTGLVLDPYFSASKLAWLLAEGGLKGRAARGELAFGTVDSWLLFRLTGVHRTDATNASRTLLFNLRTLSWDPDLLALFGIPAAVLPEVRPSFGAFGRTDPALFGARVPVAAVLGDQQAALFGQLAFEPGMAKATYGTGAFLVQRVAGFALAEGTLTTLAWLEDAGPAYALEGSIFVAGALIQWLIEGLGLAESPEEVEALAARVKDAGGVYLVPALTGLGSPHWDPHARGLVIGLTRGTGRAHLARAALEAIAYRTADALAAMAAVEPIRSLRVDGGAARSDLLMQLVADALGVPVERPVDPETTARGAALAAAVGAGQLSREDALSWWQRDRTFLPSLAPDRRQARYLGWREAVARAKGWARWSESTEDN